MNTSNPIFQYIERIRESKGFEIHWKINYLIQSHNIYFGNLNELNGHLRKHSTFESLSEFWGPRNKSKQDKEFNEFFRLFHNYMASVKTLVDHSRITSRELLKGKELAKYEDKVKNEFSEDYLTNFMQNLRNFVQHQTHPPISVISDYQNKRMGYQINLDSMRKWSGWNARAIKFINSVQNNIYVEDIVSKYSDKVNQFNLWLIEHMRASNAECLNELERYNNEYLEYCKKIGLPLTDDEWKKLDLQHNNFNHS